MLHGTGIFTFIYHKHQPVGKYTIHGSSGIFWDISVQYFFCRRNAANPLKSKQIRLHKNKSLTWEDNHISLYVGDIVECHFLHGVPDPSSGASLPENADASDPLLAQTFSSVAVQQWLQPFSDFLQWLSAQTFFCSVAFLLRLLLFSRRPGSPHHIPWGDH